VRQLSPGYYPLCFRLRVVDGEMILGFGKHDPLRQDLLLSAALVPLAIVTRDI